MLLRASGQTEGAEVEIDSVVGGGASGVAHGEVLTAFAEALVRGTESDLAAARACVMAVLGAGGLVDAAAVASNFERMNRIADATGIPLDAPVAALSADLRDRLGLDRFASAANSRRVGAVGRWFGAMLRAIVGALARRAARRLPTRDGPL